MENKKLKILMFNRWVGYNEGGNETHIKELAVFLSKKGHKIDIITTGEEALIPIKEHINKIWQVASPRKYFSYSSKRFIYSFIYLLKSFFIFYKLLKIKKIKYDIITVHFSLEAFLLRFVRAVFNIPYALILVGDTDMELIEGKRADNTSELTEYMARECLNYCYYPKILTKGVDRARFNRKVNGHKVRNLYINNKKQFLILTVCRLEPRKNLETLIKSAKILENKYPNIFKFVIIGGGIEENKLKNMVKKYRLNNVYFTGMIYSTSSLLPQYYASADIFALPTLYEGFGYVFSEAMSFGLPVIGTDTSAVPEVVSGTGIIIPLRSPIKLSQAIYSIYSDSKLRKELSRKSLKKVENWYWDKLIMDYEKFLYEAINKNRKYNNSYKRYKRCFSDLFFDFPKILFIGLRPLYKTKNSWGSILNKRYE